MNRRSFIRSIFGTAGFIGASSLLPKSLLAIGDKPQEVTKVAKASYKIPIDLNNLHWYRKDLEPIECFNKQFYFTDFGAFPTYYLDKKDNMLRQSMCAAQSHRSRISIEDVSQETIQSSFEMIADEINNNILADIHSIGKKMDCQVYLHSIHCTPFIFHPDTFVGFRAFIVRYGKFFIDPEEQTFVSTSVALKNSTQNLHG